MADNKGRKELNYLLLGLLLGVLGAVIAINSSCGRFRGRLTGQSSLVLQRADDHDRNLLRMSDAQQRAEGLVPPPVRVVETCPPERRDLGKDFCGDLEGFGVTQVPTPSKESRGGAPNARK